MKTWNKGDSVEIRTGGDDGVPFTDKTVGDGTAFDPHAVEFVYKPPNGAAVTVNYPHPSITRYGTGDYGLAIDTDIDDAEGVWYCRVTGKNASGDSRGAYDYAFRIRTVKAK